MVRSSKRKRRGQKQQSEPECSAPHVDARAKDLQVIPQDQEIDDETEIDTDANANSNEGERSEDPPKTNSEPEEEEITIHTLLRFVETKELCNDLVGELDRKMEAFECRKKAEEEEILRNQNYLRATQKNVGEILDDIKKEFIVKNNTSNKTKAQERHDDLRDVIKKLLDK